MKRREAEAVVCFETPPGKPMQVDFTEVRRGRHRPSAFVATMGYSRASFATFTEKEDAEKLCEGLREAFDYFGGVTEQVLFDNAETVVVERDAYGLGRHRRHDRLKDLAKFCGFSPRLCRPHRAKTKGKIERFHGYRKGSRLRCREECRKRSRKPFLQPFDASRGSGLFPAAGTTLRELFPVMAARADLTAAAGTTRILHGLSPLPFYGTHPSIFRMQVGQF